ncbi:MAG: DUF58 domain-containing protein [Candidatus Dormibacteria bacterium]
MSTRAPLLATVAVLALFAGVTGIQLAYTLAYTLGLLLLVAWLWARLVSRRLRVERESPEGSFSVGEPFAERFTVRNGSALPIAYCEVRDGSRLPGYAPGRACALKPGEAVSWSARGAFAERGRHHFGPLEAQVGDPFGLFPRTVRAGAQRSVLVHPALHPVEEIAPVWGGSSGGDSRHGRVHDVPPDVATVREYQPSDGQSRIHWASTARTGRLMSRSYDTHNRADLLVVLDLHSGIHAGRGADSSLEYAVSVAASICSASLRRGQAVGLVTNDLNCTAFGAGRGEAQRLRLLDYLAEARDNGDVSLAETIVRHSRGWRGRGGLVVVTGSHDPSWVDNLLDAGVRGQRHLAVLVDPVSFGAPGTLMKVNAAWRVALDWWLIHRGDQLGAPHATLTAAR